MYEYIKYGADRQITLEKGNYLQSDNLAVEMVSHDTGYPEAWNTLTVNLGVQLRPNCAYIDTNNNGEEIIQWLSKNNIAYPTGRTASSGYCVYPEVEFTSEALEIMQEI